LWSAVGALHAPRKLARLMAWLGGRTDHMALEIIAQDGLIAFYLAVPKMLKEFMEQQVHAQYPHASLEEVVDYNIFSPRGVTLGANLFCGRSWGFPLKTYKQFEADPLNSITNAMSKIVSGDGAAVQFIVRSAPKSWRQAGVKLASAMQQGKSLHEASGVGAVLKSLHIINSLVPSSSSKKSSSSASKESYKLSPLEEEMVKGIEQKASKAGLEVNIRLVASSHTRETADLYLNNLINAFGQFNVYQYGNQFKFKRPRSLDHFLYNFVHRVPVERKRMIMNVEELASLYHFPLPSTETPNIRWMTARRAAAPVNMPTEGLALGVNSYRGVDATVRIKPDDRRRHVYIIGKSCTGKSVMLQ
ncbi:MAG: hypothetical protein AAB956_04025, partial [Patescibacteria group bacterium]